MSDNDASPDKKDSTERRVYNLPAGLLARLRAYQVSQGINSEAEAARRLLDYALQMRDTVFNILDTLEARFAEEKDLRVLAGDVLSKHTLVTMVSFEEEAVVFVLRNRTRGRIDSQGCLYSQEADENGDYWTSYRRQKPKVSVKPSGDTTSKSDDLDDEIPF